MEQVTLRARDGATSTARTEVTRYTNGQRLTRALPIAIGGSIFGLCTIIIPGVHFVSVWAIPLLSCGVGYYYYNRLGMIGEVEGTCPTCSADTASEGGAWEDPMWVRCSACEAPLEVVLNTPME